MPNWKKVIVSGSDAILNTVTADGTITANAFSGDGSSLTGMNTNQLTNGAGFTTNTGTVTSVATGTGLTGGTITSTGTISLSHLGFQNLTDPNDDRIAFWDDSAGAFAWLDIGSGLSISGTTISNTITNNNQLTNGAGYITSLDWTELGGSQDSINVSGFNNDAGYTSNLGDITGVTAGTGISGGGTSGTVTITNDDRGSSQNIFKNVAVSGQTSIVADSNNDTLTFAAGAGIGLTTNATTDTLTITNSITNNNQLTNGAGYITATSTNTLSNKGGNISQWTNDSGYITEETYTGTVSSVGITAGTGLSGGGTITTSGTISLAVDLSELTDMTAAMVGTDEFIVLDAGADRRKAANEIPLSIFSNDSGFTSNSGTITGVTAGSGLTGGGSSGGVTLNIGAGTGVTVNADDISIGQAVGTSDDVTFNNLTLSGDLTVNGTTTTISTTNTAISDNLIELNSGVTSNANDSGIIIERGTTGNNALFIWDESADRFAVGTTTATAGSTGNITFSTANLEANTFVGALSGNATTATSAGKWSTSRTLTLGGDLTGNVTFDGSTNFTLTAAVANDSHTHDSRYYTESEVDTLLSAKDNYGSWTVSDGTTSTDISSGGTLSFSAGSNVDISESAGTITITASDSNTTYSAGNGIGLTGTTFSVAAGTGLTQDASGLSLSTAGAGAGTYGSTANGTKIDTITIDAYGRVTAVATGATGTSSTSGTVTSVATGTGLTGGTITSTGTISLVYEGAGENFIDAATNLEGTSIATGDTIVYHDANDNTVKKGLVSDLPLDNYTKWQVSDGTTSTNVTSGTTVTFSAGSNVDISNSSNTISISATDTNTTYSAGSLLDLSGTTFNVDLSELTDMTTAWVNSTDEFVVLDSGVQKRKLSSEIFGSNAFNSTTIPTNNNQLTNGAGYLTAHPSISAAASVDNSARTYIQDITLDSNGHVIGLTSATETVINTDTNYYLDGITKSGNTLTFSVNGTTNQSYSFGSNAFNSTTIPTNNNQLTNGAGYTTNTGTITGVTAGTGLSGGGSSGTVTLNVSGLTTSQLAGGSLQTSAELFSDSDSVLMTAAAIDDRIDSKTYGNWQFSAEGSNFSVNAGSTVTLNAGANVDITHDGSGNVDISATDNNTTYSAGTGLNLNPATTFNVDTNLATDGVHTIGRDGNDKFVVNTTNHAWYLDGVLDMRLANNGQLDVDGNIVAYSTVTNSDRRLKTDISTIESASEKVSKLRGVEYTWDYGKLKGKRDIGLIAQEVEEVIPEVVTDGELLDGTEAKRVDYGKLVGLLIEANKEQQTQIQSLIKEVKELKGRL